MDLDLIIQIEGEEPIFISAPETLGELVEAVKSSCNLGDGQPVLLYNRKDRWVKIIDNKTYQRTLKKVLSSGVDELELKLQVNQPLRSIPDFSFDEHSAPSESWELISERSQVSTAFPIQLSVKTISYLRIDGTDRDYVNIRIPDDISLQELSSLIVQNEGFPSGWSCALYSSDGYPLTGNLSQMLYTKCSDVLEDHARICLFIVPDFDSKTLEPLDPSDGPNAITIADYSDASLQHSVRISNSTTVKELKQKVYSVTGIPTFELNLRTDDMFFAQNGKTVSSYGNPSLVKYERVFVNYKDGSYKENTEQSIEQTKEGLNILHTFLYAFSNISSSCDSPTVAQFLSGVRIASNNCTPLVHALYELSKNKKMSLLDTIALEEGFILLTKRVLTSVFDMEVAPNKILEHSLDVCGILASTFSRNNEIHRQETFKEKDIIDPLEFNVMKNPVLVAKQDGTMAYYDKTSLLNKINSNQSIQGVPRLSKDALEVDHYFKMIVKRCELNGKTSLFVWTGSYSPRLSFIDQIRAAHPGGLNWMRALDLKRAYKITKVVPPLSLKDTNYKNCITLDKSKKLCINRGLTPKMPNKVDLLDVISSSTTSVDVDDLASAVELQSREESKESLTRVPAEAIVVVFDKSGSMGESFVNNHEFTRLAATKQFFESFADRTVGYNYPHAMSLILFSSSIEKACGFTENLSTFAHHAQKCTNSGQTRLFDSISTAVDALKEFQKTYSSCQLRVLCLSDGQDNCSNISAVDLAKKLLLHKVTLDSVVVGLLSQDLKAISFATGGYVFLPSSVQSGIQLFESESFLSLRNRDPPNRTHIISYDDLRNLANRPFSEDLPSMKKPNQLSSQLEHPRATIQRAAATPPQFQNRGMGARFKRIMKELNNLANNPHPSIEVYPAVDDPNFWNAYMQGPEQTPYQNGVFHIYIAFGENYPQEAPIVRFITPIYHCNINSNGRICHSILDQFYRVDVTLRHILDCIYGLLMTPEPLDPLDANIAAEYLDNVSVYNMKATEFTNKYAKQQLNRVGYVSSTPSHLCDPITGAIMSDPVICIKSNSTYERREIERIIRETGTDPLTGQSITTQDLIPNIQLKQAIETHVKALNNPWFLN